MGNISLAYTLRRPTKVVNHFKTLSYTKVCKNTGVFKCVNCIINKEVVLHVQVYLKRCQEANTVSNMLTRISQLLLVLLILLSVSICSLPYRTRSSSKRPQSPPPHIVVLLADDLGFNDISWHNDMVLSPNLASLASQGVTLEQHYSHPACTPTRGALLTGR